MYRDYLSSRRACSCKLSRTIFLCSHGFDLPARLLAANARLNLGCSFLLLAEKLIACQVVLVHKPRFNTGRLLLCKPRASVWILLPLIVHPLEGSSVSFTLLHFLQTSDKDLPSKNTFVGFRLLLHGIALVFQLENLFSNAAAVRSVQLLSVSRSPLLLKRFVIPHCQLIAQSLCQSPSALRRSSFQLLFHNCVSVPPLDDCRCLLLCLNFFFCARVDLINQLRRPGLLFANTPFLVLRLLDIICLHLFLPFLLHGFHGLHL
mmetsp:Transcript_25651/g.48524  ORF Transcript_25651/g.48524 Transcript_25651/m.48524 type:complete len:262 (-) Transcript_25651:1408-2193(-)